MGVSRGALRPAAPRCPGPLPPARSVFIGAAAAPPSALCNNTAITCGKRGAGGKQKPGQQPGGGGRRKRIELQKEKAAVALEKDLE
ncbi:hypothetical protein DV515_00000198, partial [Chloebia gouldiae]